MWKVSGVYSRDNRGFGCLLCGLLLSTGGVAAAGPRVGALATAVVDHFGFFGGLCLNGLHRCSLVGRGDSRFEMGFRSLLMCLRRFLSVRRISAY